MLSLLCWEQPISKLNRETQNFESKFFGAHFSPSGKAQPSAFWLLKGENLELNPPAYYPDNAAAIAASRNLFEETGAEIVENMKANRNIRKML